MDIVVVVIPHFMFIVNDLTYFTAAVGQADVDGSRELLDGGRD